MSARPRELQHCFYTDGWPSAKLAARGIANVLRQLGIVRRQPVSISKNINRNFLFSISKPLLYTPKARR
jgi:predicted deacylase